MSSATNRPTSHTDIRIERKSVVRGTVVGPKYSNGLTLYRSNRSSFNARDRKPVGLLCYRRHVTEYGACFVNASREL